MVENPLVLVTGATGYVGSRIIPRLLEAGYRLRVLTRDSRRLEGRTWTPRVEIVEGDVLRSETLPKAMRGVDYAYYFIHSMSDTAQFSQRDQLAASNFGAAARDFQVKRIVYLGGLGDPDSDLSSHLRSRQQTGDVLRQSGVPVTEFRAAIIVGSGSASFEMIRYLTERLPVMITPRWVSTKVQPIAIHNVLEYLIRSLDVPESEGQIIEIGGEDLLTYGEMMKSYARLRGLKRMLIPVPVLTPRLSSYWVHWVTPLHANIARPLIDGLRNEVIVRDPSARDVFPEIHPVDYHSAVEQALGELNADRVESTWSDSLGTTSGDQAPVQLSNTEGMIMEKRKRIIPAPPGMVFALISSIGGKNGWLFAGFLWRLRGMLDRLVGGVGLRRGRRHPKDLRVGDPLDFWRVEGIEPDRLIRLRAEMKLPGEAWLQFEMLPRAEGSTKLVQTAYFAPRGLLGHLYWYALYPIHKIVFSGLIGAIAQRSYPERLPQASSRI
jgi:uncharacterized protein YbjT (DUF2867 family)/uncharacterized protein YndB with AHSA1/START domain